MTNIDGHCKIVGCTSTAKRRVKGFCIMHYERQRRTGETGEAWGRGTNPNICVVPDCNDSPGPTGSCRKHWHRVNSPAGRGRSTRLFKTYGINQATYDQMLEAQGGRCKICPATVPGGRIKHFAVDHDHKCCPGKTSCGNCVRALLCSRCNLTLGAVGDSVDLLTKMVQYLEAEHTLEFVYELSLLADKPEE